MTESHVDAAVAARIAAAKVKIQAARERRESFAQARKRGLARRHAAKLARLVEAEERAQQRQADEPEESP